MRVWRKYDTAFLETRHGYIFCTIVDVSDPDVVTVEFEGAEEPVRVARGRLRE